MLPLLPPLPAAKIREPRVTQHGESLGHRTCVIHHVNEPPVWVFSVSTGNFLEYVAWFGLPQCRFWVFLSASVKHGRTLPSTAFPLSSWEKDPVAAPCPCALSAQGRGDGLSRSERGAGDAEGVGLIPVGPFRGWTPRSLWVLSDTDYAVIL